MSLAVQAERLARLAAGRVGVQGSDLPARSRVLRVVMALREVSEAPKGVRVGSERGQGPAAFAVLRRMQGARVTRSTPAQKAGPQRPGGGHAARVSPTRWRGGGGLSRGTSQQTRSNHVTPCWSGPGSAKQPDSLLGAWWALPPGLLWLNPPYANIAKWTEKCARWRAVEAGAASEQRIALLVPASVGSNWFAEHVDGKALVIFLRPRLTFVGHVDPYPKDLLLAIYGLPPGYECWRWRQ